MSDLEFEHQLVVRRIRLKLQRAAQCTIFECNALRHAIRENDKARFKLAMRTAGLANLMQRHGL